MFGMGGTEILVILIVALLFLGPDKLPEAAKQISKGIRDIKKQSRALQQTIEDDEHIGGAIRDLRSALRGEEAPIRPKASKPKQIDAATPDPVPAIGAAAAAIAAGEPGAPGDTDAPGADAADANAAAAAVDAADAQAAFAGIEGHSGASFESDPAHLATAAPSAATSAPAGDANGGASRVTLPPTAGEAAGEAAREAAREAADGAASDQEASAELAGLVKPAPNTIARGASTGSSDPSERKHG